MTNHPYIRFRNAEESGDIRAGLLVIESHHHYSAFALFEVLHAAKTAADTLAFLAIKSPCMEE